MKQNLAGVRRGPRGDPAKAEKYLAEAKRYSDEKKDIQKEAEKLEKESAAFS